MKRERSVWNSLKAVWCQIKLEEWTLDIETFVGILKCYDWNAGPAFKKVTERINLYL